MCLLKTWHVETCAATICGCLNKPKNRMETYQSPFCVKHLSRESDHAHCFSLYHGYSYMQLHTHFHSHNYRLLLNTGSQDLFCQSSTTSRSRKTSIISRQTGTGGTRTECSFLEFVRCGRTWTYCTPTPSADRPHLTTLLARKTRNCCFYISVCVCVCVEQTRYNVLTREL